MKDTNFKTNWDSKEIKIFFKKYIQIIFIIKLIQKKISKKSAFYKTKKR